MSDLIDNATTIFRARLADNVGDSVTYTPNAGTGAETVNAQIEPYERADETQEDDQWKQLETNVGVIVGTEDGDVSEVVLGDTMTFHGFIWGVVRILSRFGATGIVRMVVVSQSKATIGVPGVVRTAPAHPTGGRFDKRGT